MKPAILTSYRTRMIAGFLVVNMLALAIALAIADRQIGRVVKQDVLQQSGDAAARFNYDMDTYVEELVEAAAPLAAEQRIQQFLVQDRTSTAEETEAIEKELQNFVAANRPEIAGMFLMSDQNRLISIFSYYFSQSDFYSAEPWFTLPFGTTVELYPTHVTRYPNQAQFPVFSVVIPIYDIDTVEVAGRFVLDIQPERIIESFGERGLGRTGYHFVVSSDGIVVYHPNKEWIGKSIEDTPLSDLRQAYADSPGKVDWQGEQWYVSVDRSNRMNWNIYSIVPSSEMESGLRAVRMSIVWTFAIVSLLILIAVPLLTDRFTKRVIALKNVMAKASTGDLEVRAEEGGSPDEIHYLYRGFNQMMDRLQQLVGEVYDLQLKEMQLTIRQKEAVIRSLQNQINPHLLYNTLGVIKSMAYLENVPKIERISRNLADVYRYTAQFEYEEVTLRDELDIVAKYLDIVRLRFPSSFTSLLSVADKFLSARCMKLTLQPIVENAVKYAIEPGGGDGAIVVSAYDEGEDLFVEIADNGRGIAAEKLRELRAALEEVEAEPGETPGERRSLGLANVHARLILRYGPSYGLRIDSFSGQGTVVTVRVPLRSPERQVRENE
ncbi:cache domain-containing sensor histidine kinase [Cohnella fermenti]|uniref:histidine kinase n=1 Tax=Cohnella fermenti TaxID=2565925 RepID=A0A4S4C939_9BACL|nr:sensor histidine kinase [Cohnella fermenti]THF84514.1 sensor histidine kinase [Cohnella fermenti]